MCLHCYYQHSDEHVFFPRSFSLHPPPQSAWKLIKSCLSLIWDKRWVVALMLEQTHSGGSVQRHAVSVRCVAASNSCVWLTYKYKQLSHGAESVSWVTEYLASGTSGREGELLMLLLDLVTQLTQIFIFLYTCAICFGTSSRNKLWQLTGRKDITSRCLMLGLSTKNIDKHSRYIIFNRRAVHEHNHA